MYVSNLRIGVVLSVLIMLTACGGSSSNTQNSSVSSSSLANSTLSSAQSSISSTTSANKSSNSSSQSLVSSSAASSSPSSIHSSISSESSSAASSSLTSNTRLMGGAIQGAPLNLKADVTTWVNSSAGLLDPVGVTTDGENIYLADRGNDVIRKIVISTGVITTLAGKEDESGNIDGVGEAARFDRPNGITTDGVNLYVTDLNNHSIRKIVIATGAVTTLAGHEESTFGDSDGVGSAAGFFYPSGITTDGVNLFVADTYNHAIRKIVIATGAVITLAGSMFQGGTDGVGTEAEFNLPRGIITDGVNVYVADTGNTTIRKIVITSRTVSTLAGTVDSSLGDVDGTGVAASFAYPSGLTSDGSNLYVADPLSNTIRKIVIATVVVTTIAGTETISGHTDGTAEMARFDFPVSLTTDGKSLFISDRNNNLLRKIH